jgi:DNA-binding MurR/RpiR family transcriptional regulator
MTFTKICRSLGFINYPLLRAQVTESIENLENRGYIIRGAYNRIIRKTH